jgi:hypothetical protein
MRQVDGRKKNVLIRGGLVVAKEGSRNETGEYNPILREGTQAGSEPR